MLRLWDWECQKCGERHEELVDVPSGEKTRPVMTLACKRCGKTMKHSRVFPLPARYMGDRPLCPTVYGGSFDTMGREPEPRLPLVPSDNKPIGYWEHATKSERKARFDQIADHVTRKEYQEIRQAQKAVRQRNRVKRERAKLIKQGKVTNLRDCKLPGDPKLTA